MQDLIPRQGNTDIS